MERYIITVTARYAVTAPSDGAALERLADRFAEPKDAAVVMLAWDGTCEETARVLSCARTKPAQGQLALEG
jgi:hypothetical protein